MIRSSLVLALVLLAGGAALHAQPGGTTIISTSPSTESPDEEIDPASYSQDELISHVRYPEWAVPSKNEGKAEVQVVIERDGAPTNMKVVRTDDTMFNRTVVEAVTATRFKPARRDGDNVRTTITVTVPFLLPASLLWQPSAADITPVATTGAASSAGASGGGEVAVSTSGDEEPYDPSLMKGDTSFVPPSFDPYDLARSVAYPLRARQNNLEGEVRVRFIVEANGSATNPEIVQSTNPIFDQSAIDAITKTAFVPARNGGNVVRSYMTLPVRFRLASE